MQNALQTEPIQTDSIYLLSDIALLVSPRSRHTFPVTLATAPLWSSPDQNQSLWKVRTMKDPKSGLRPPAQNSFRFHPAQHEVQRQSDEASELQSSQQSKLSDNLQIPFSETDSRCFGSAQTILPDENSVAHVCQGDSTAQPLTTPLLADSLLSIVTVPQQLDAKALPLDWLLGPKVATPYTKVLAALIRLEARANKDQDVAWAEDCRQTWIAIRKLESGECTHFSTATAQACLEMFGVSILQLQNRIMQRRMSKLGKEFPDWYDANGRLIPDSEVLARKNGEPGAGQAGECPTQTQQPPIALPGIFKKPVQSIPSSQVKEEAQ